jgi:hypothetical protein
MHHKLIFFIIISIILLIIIKYKIDKVSIDKFKNAKQAINADGNPTMTFDFLSNTNKILAKYFLSDDLNNNNAYQRYVINYPYKNKFRNYNVKGALPYVYTGNPGLHYQRAPGIWNRYNTYAQDIYNMYGVRR